MGAGPDWRATLAAAPLTSAIFVGAILVTFASTVGLAAGWPAFLSRWLGLSLDSAPFVWPFLTYVLPHDPGSPVHIVFNLLLLWFLGRELEMRLSRGPYATLFFGAAITGGIAHLAFNAWRENLSPVIGASGGLMGLLFFMARLEPDRPVVFFFFRVPLKVLAVILAIFDLHPLLLGAPDGVARLAHLGGAIFGLCWFRWRFDAFSAWRALVARRQERRARRAQEEVAKNDGEMDRLLAKIHAGGIGSLSQREREFLQRRSAALKESRGRDGS
jgi:membrane associated rhomboid family serine protease